MSISNYSQLKSVIADELNRADLTSVIPTFIRLAESSINRDLRVRQMVTRSDATIDTQYTALPGDFVAMKSFYLKTDPVTKLQFRTNEQLADMKASRILVGGGKPRDFTIIGSTVELYPAPSGSYTGEMIYYGKVPALSDNATTNWLLTEWPDLYFYGSLIHSAPYLKDDARAGLWAEFYGNILNAINLADERAEFSGGVLKARTTRSY